MSAVLKTQEPSAQYLAALRPPLVEHFDLVASAPGGVARLRELILTLAVRGKLVPQDPEDEPASALLAQVRTEKMQLVAGGKIKQTKPLEEITAPEIPFSLPPGWIWVRLGTLLQKIGSGSTPLGGKEVYVSSGIKFLRSQNVWNDGLRLDGVVFITPKIHAQMVGTVVRANDLLFNITGASIGRCAVVPYDFDEANVSQHVTILRPVLKTLNPYLHKVMISRRVQQSVMDVQVGVSREGLSVGKLSRFLIPLPPLAEQSRIVARVEDLMRLCDVLEAKGRLEDAQHAQLLDTLLGTLTDSAPAEELAANCQCVAAHLELLLDRQEAVDALEHTILRLAVSGLLGPQCASEESATTLLSRIRRSRQSSRKLIEPDRDAIARSGHTLPPSWAWASVDQLAADSDTAITDGPFGANLKTEHYVESRGFRVVRLQNIGTGTFRSEHHAYIDRERFDSLQKHRIFGGDIVVAGLVDESIRCCIVPPDVGPAIVKADCYRFSVHEAISSEFVCFYLSSKAAHEFASVHHHGLTLTRIGLGNFRSLPVPLPPFEEQRRIVARVNQLRRLCADLREKLASAQATQVRLADALVESAASAG